MYFKNRKHLKSWGFYRHIFLALLVIIAALLYVTAVLTGARQVPPTDAGKAFLTLSYVLFWFSGVAAVFSVLSLLYDNVEIHKKNGERLDNAVEMLSRQNNLLLHISQAGRLSDTAKEIVFRDAEQMELGEAALTKLHQHDFDEAEAMIATMAEYPRYAELANRLMKMFEKYRTATEEGRINQIISYIESLFDQHLWLQAAAQIENLVKMFPYSEKAQAMPLRMSERKDRRKRELLADWDIAVREKSTDRGLEILKELDMYLTPREALALQESASTVFKTKLHNLGVEFSVAVTEQNWTKAVDTGREIIRRFPNSRMAEEIREKMDILLERAHTSGPLQQTATT